MQTHRQKEKQTPGCVGTGIWKWRSPCECIQTLTWLREWYTIMIIKMKTHSVTKYLNRTSLFLMEVPFFNFSTIRKIKWNLYRVVACLRRRLSTYRNKLEFTNGMALNPRIFMELRSFQFLLAFYGTLMSITQHPAIWPCPEPDEFSSHLSKIFIKCTF